MTAPDREAPSTSWAVWAWQAYREGRLVEAPATPAATDPKVKALVEAAENVVIARGMGWDMDGVLDVLTECTDALRGIGGDP